MTKRNLIVLAGIVVVIIAAAWFPTIAVPVLIGIIFVFGMIGLYFMPSIVAAERRHRQNKAILVLNIFLGWTVIGWVAALVWAFTSDTKPQMI